LKNLKSLQQLLVRIRRLRTNNGGEYVSKEIFHEFIVFHSPEQNGVAKRMNCTLVESACSMLSHAGLPKKFWAEAIATATYIPSETACQQQQSEKIKCLMKGGMEGESLGCMTYVHIPESQRKKLDKKSEKLWLFVGYSIQSKG